MDDKDAFFSPSRPDDNPSSTTAIQMLEKLERLKLAGASQELKKGLEKMIEETFKHGAAAAGQQGLVSGQDTGRGQRRRDPDHMAKLCMRMGWNVVGICHRAKINIIADGGKVFIQGVRNGEPFTLAGNDDNLFPNDELVTQLRLIYGDEDL